MPDAADGVAALVLAAGGGARLGGGKLLLPWRGRPVILHTLGAVAAVPHVREIVLVTGHGAERMREVVRDGFLAASPPLRIVENPRWRDGQSASLRRGVAEIMAAPRLNSLAGVMIVLGDQPLVRSETFGLLAEAHIAASRRTPGHLATVPVHGGRRGNPVVLSPELFPDVMRLEGDVGARRILAALGDETLRVPVDDPAVLRDVDTPEDYAGLDGS